MQDCVILSAARLARRFIITSSKMILTIVPNQVTHNACANATMSSVERFADDGMLRVATWNVAAINNNPFEYVITHDDPAYNQLMLDVESLIDNPGDLDLTVGQILDESIVLDLFSHLRAEGFNGVEETVEYWRCNLKDRRYGRMFPHDCVESPSGTPLQGSQGSHRPKS